MATPVKKVGKYAVFVGPLLVVSSRAVPEERRGLRLGLMVVGGFLTATGIVREYTRSAWGS